jgi:glycosyltransferase involved in cell wall biosynthesis
MLDALVVRPAMRLFRPRLVVMDVLMDEYIKSRYGRAFSGLEYIPVGVDPARVVGGDGGSVRERHDLGDAPLVVSLGHVIPLRDRVLLVQALPTLLRRHPHAKVLVVGRVYYNLFLQLARDLGVAHAVVAVGAVPKEQVADYLAAADVEAHDLQGYGMGTASLESMAAGVPLVVSVRPDNFPGIELRHGENVLLTPTEDPEALGHLLADLLDDPQWRSRVAAQQQQLIDEHFTMTTVVRRHLEVLAAMSAEAGPGRRSRTGLRPWRRRGGPRRTP